MKGGGLLGIALTVVSTAVLTAVLGACSPASEDVQENAQRRGRVILVGVDSVGWPLLDPLLASGELPNVAALIKRGLAAELETVEPVISPPNWTSIATGRRPAAHGVISFFHDRRTIQVPTAWERLAAAGLRVGLYDYLITWPPRALPDGFMIPGWLRRDPRVEPPDLVERVGFSPHLYEALDHGGLDRRIEVYELEMRRKPDDFLRLIEAFDLDVGAMGIYAIDTASHTFFHTWAPESFDPPIAVADRHRNALADALRVLDQALGELVAGLRPEDHLIVVSDHGARAQGFPDRKWGYATERILELAGLEAERDGVEVVNGFLSMAFAIHGPAEGAAADATRTLQRLAEICAAVRGEAGALFEVKVVDSADLAGEDSLDIEPWQAEILDTTVEAAGFVFAVVRPEAVEEIWPAGLVTVGGLHGLPVSELLEAHDFTGDHDPLGLLLVAGPAIRAVPNRLRASVLDIASLVLYLAGQPIPDDLEGFFDPAWIEPGHLAKERPRRTPAEEAPRLPAEDPAAIDAAGEDLRKRLRALGYLGGAS